MNRVHLTLSTLLIAALIAGAETLSAAEKPGKASVNAVVKGNTAFALRMHQELSSTEGNLFFSPYSISSALGMTYAGARNNTEKEMKVALHFPGRREELFRSFGELQEALHTVQKAGDIKLSIANAIWAEKSYKFLPGFMYLVEKEYKSKISLADFVGDAEAVYDRVLDSSGIGGFEHRRAESAHQAGFFHGHHKVRLPHGCQDSCDVQRFHETSVNDSDL